MSDQAEMQPRRPRLTRAERRAQTRARLLVSAREVFAERGFYAASVDDVAERAGLTSGALYGNFAGKEELFLAVLDEHVADRVGSVVRATAAVEGSCAVRAGADDWMRFLREQPSWYPLFIEFWSYAVRHEELRPQLARRFGAFPESTARLVRVGAARQGLEIPDDVASALGILFTALADGLALMKLMDPTAVPDELFGDALSALAELTRGGGTNDEA